MTTAVRNWLLGVVAVPNHPATALNPNGREGFVITEVKVEGDTIYLRGPDTMWFGERSILELRTQRTP